MILRKPCGCAKRMAATLRDVAKSLKARADHNLATALHPRTNSGCRDKPKLDDEARRLYAREMLEVTASEQIARFADTAEDARSVLDYAAAEADKADGEGEALTRHAKDRAKRAEEALLADYLSRSKDVLGLDRWENGHVVPRMRRGGAAPDGPNTERLRAEDFAAWSAVNGARRAGWEREVYAVALRSRAWNVAHYAEGCTCSVEVVAEEEQR